MKRYTRREGDRIAVPQERLEEALARLAQLEDMMQDLAAQQEEIPRRLRSNFSESAYLADCEDRAASACYAFTADGDRFTARINLERDNLVFFTVPYESGWSATVTPASADTPRTCSIWAQRCCTRLRSCRSSPMRRSMTASWRCSASRLLSML